MRSPSLAFLTPVYDRFSLTEVCLRQRRWVCDQLKERYGIDATCIAVGDDANLNTAQGFGFEAVEHPNKAVHLGVEHVALGMKFNAAYKHAHKLGIDYVFPIGSDSWIDPVYFDELPEEGEFYVSRAYNLITANTERRGALWIGWEGGVQWIARVSAWAHRKYEPVSPSLAKGCDTSTWVHKLPSTVIRERHHHQLEYVAFQSVSEQITNYAHIMAKYGRGEVMGAEVFTGLEPHYRMEDILAVRAHYAAELLQEVEERIALYEAELSTHWNRRAELQFQGDELRLMRQQLVAA